MQTNEWFFPRGALQRSPWDVVVDRSIEGWLSAGLRVGTLDGVLALGEEQVERMLLPLAGSFTVRAGGATFPLGGRNSVFDGPADVLSLGPGTGIEIEGHGRIAVAEAPSTAARPPSLLRGSEVPIEIRGTGGSTRQVHNFGVLGALEAERLIVCEVITPAGNWSSYPAHKHDEAGPHESRLEEVYYFEVASPRGSRAPAGADPFGMFASYSSPAGAIDTSALVRSGDVALVPFGYHGPAAAPPGSDLYYLNVMAGTGRERSWRITDDPGQSWIRGSWSQQQPDPRLPYRTERLA